MSATDYELLCRWTQGRDAEAFKEVASRHAPMVYAVCRRVLGDAIEAEDVAQECFEALVARGSAPGAYLGAWLHRVATNLALKRRRSNVRRHAREARYAAERPVHAEVGWEELHRHVDEAVADLPEKLRLPIVLHFYESRTHEAIARELSVSRGTVGYRIGQGVERIRAQLRRRGVTAPAGVLAALLTRHLPAEAAPQAVAAAIGRLALAGAVGTARSGGVSLILGGLAVKKVLVVAAVVAVALWVAWKSGPFVSEESSAPVIPTGAVEAAAPAETAAPATALSPPPTAGVSASEAVTLPAVEGRAYREESGKGVGGLEVYVKLVEGDDASLVSAVTDGEGHFLFQGLRPGAYELNYRYFGTERTGLPRPPDPGMTEPVVTVRVVGPPAVHRADLPLRMGLRVAGRVVDEQGKPVSGAQVEARDRNDLRSLEIYTTGDEGTFELFGFRETQALTLEAAVRPELVSDFYGPVALGPNGLEDIVLVMRRTAKVSGKVVDTNGVPLAGASVRASAVLPGGSRDHNRLQRLVGIASDDTDAAGRFSVGGLAPGTSSLRVSMKGRSRTPEPPGDRFELKPGEVREDVVLVVESLSAEELEANLRITGRVVDAKGEPVGDVEVSAWSEKGIRNDWTKDDGAFVLTDLKPGAYRVEARERSAKRGAITRLEQVEAGTEGVEIVLPALGNIEGRVVDANTGAPVTTYEIAHRDERNRGQGSAQRDYRRVQSEDGSFRLTAVEPGPVTVVAKAAGYAESTVDVPLVKPGETVRAVEVRLKPGLSLSGTVVNAEGRPVANAAIVPGPLPGHEHPDKVAATRTDGHGAFHLSDLTALDVVSAYHPDYAAGETPVNLAAGRENNVRIVLTRGCVIEGTAYFDEEPWPGQEVRLNAGFSDGGWYFEGVGALTSETGSYRFEKVRPGAAYMMMFAPARLGEPSDRPRSQARSFTVPKDGTLRVDFHFTSAESVLEGIVTAGGRAFEESTAPWLHLILPVADDAGNRSASEQYSAKCAADGTYRFEGVASGHGKLIVSVPWSNGSVAEVELDIPPAGTVRRDIEIGAPPEP